MIYYYVTLAVHEGHFLSLVLFLFFTRPLATVAIIQANYFWLSWAFFNKIKFTFVFTSPLDGQLNLRILFISVNCTKCICKYVMHIVLHPLWNVSCMNYCWSVIFKWITRSSVVITWIGPFFNVSDFVCWKQKLYSQIFVFFSVHLWFGTQNIVTTCIYKWIKLS